LQQVVEQNDKQRFAFNADGTHLRANQGHSIKIDLSLEPITPPEHLYHGTATRFVESIRQRGLLHGKRAYVHLSPMKSPRSKSEHVMALRSC
jgi:putative RNA 2'-phosphotransferase